MTLIPPKEITEPNVLLVEGDDEVHFFRAIGLSIGLRGLQVIAAGGCERFRELLPVILKTSRFSQVIAYAVVRDADDDPDAAFQSVTNTLKASGQDPPSEPNTWNRKTTPRVGVFIVPGNQRRGMLEDLCLATVAIAPGMACVEAFMECLRRSLKDASQGAERPSRETYYYPKNESKARARAFLASLYWDLPSVGVAAEKGIWDFSHEALGPLREFLKGFA